MESEQTREHRLVVLLGGIFFLLPTAVGMHRISSHNDALGWVVASVGGIASAFCFWAWRFGSARLVKAIARGL